MFSISGLDPSEGSKLNQIDSLISFYIETEDFLDSSKLNVYINQELAILSGSFQDNYDGLDSEIIIDEKITEITIAKKNLYKLGSKVSVSIVILDDSGTFNRAYSFNIIPKEPILKYSNITQNRILTSAEVLYFEIIDLIDDVNLNSINFNLNGKAVISNGSFDSEFDKYSNISKIDNGYSITIDQKEFFRNGDYLVEYQAEDTNSNKLIGKLNFKVDLKKLYFLIFFHKVIF